MVPYLQSKLFNSFPKLRHGFFGRQGGVSTGDFYSLNCALESGDDQQKVLENRRRLIQTLTPEHPFDLSLNHQIHSNVVHLVDSTNKHMVREGDGLVTQTPGIILGIFTADCTPVIFYCPQSQIIGACHAGWRGAYAGVVQATISAMQDEGAKEIHASIGPCLGFNSFEVSQDFQDQFLEQNPAHSQFFKTHANPSKAYFNIRAYVEACLKEAGAVTWDHVDHDTYLEEDFFFSFRRKTHRNEAHFGNQLSCIALAKPT